jgi:hypothetical protein
VIERVILGIADVPMLSAKLGRSQTAASSSFLLKLQIKELPGRSHRLDRIFGTREIIPNRSYIP